MENLRIEHTHTSNETICRGRGRNGLIELCRFIFALCVVSHHAIFLSEPGRIPFIGGYISVEFFFMLTGYFLFEGSQSKRNSEEDKCNVLHEVIKRVKKVYPYFLVSWFASFAISHITNGTFNPSKLVWDLLRGIPQLLFLSMAGLGGSSDGIWDYVGTGWYVSALVLSIFILYPLMRRCGTYFASGIAPAAVLLIYGFIVQKYNFLGVVNERSSFCYDGVYRAIAGICLGSFCWYAVHSIPKKQLSNFGRNAFSVIQIILIALILFLMDHYTGFNDVIQVMLFAALIIVSFSWDSSLNALCTGRVSNALGSFSMVIFITQSVTYMYPILPYPSQWNLRYLAHFGYVLLFSATNYLLVALLKRLFSKIRLKQLLFVEG